MSDLKIISQHQFPKIKPSTSDSTKNEKSFVKEPNNNKSYKKVILSGLAASATIAAGILAINKGKALKFIKEISIDKFKAAGNTLKNGKAFKKNGKPFSGTVSTIGKDGFKRNLEYRDGMLKQVEEFSPVNISGKTEYIKHSKKTYNYTPEGKLESVDNYSWGHESSLDPKKGGMEYIKTSSINLDQNRAEGLKKYAQKQAEIQKQKEIQLKIETTRQQLSQKREINAETIDKSFGNYADRKETSDAYGRLTDKFEYLEKKEKAIKEKVSRLKEKMHQKSEINAQTIDNRFATENKELESLNSFYRDLETKSIKKAERKAYLKTHPEEAKALRKAQKAKSLKARTTESRYYSDEFGHDVVDITVKGKNGSIVEKIYTPDKKTLLREFHINPQCTTRVTKSNSSVVEQKITVTEHRAPNSYCVYTTVNKQKVKAPNGKYIDVKRTIKGDYGTISTSDGSYSLISCKEKNVYKLKNGNSMTEFIDYNGDKIQIIRNPKGQIIKEEFISSASSGANGPKPTPPSIKLLEQWFIDYKALCKKYGLSPLNGDTGSGTWQHYQDLLLRDTDYIEFLSTLKTLKYRAQYDTDAGIRLLRLNGLGFDIQIIKQLLTKVMNEQGRDQLANYVETLCFKLPEYEYEIRNAMDNVITHMNTIGNNPYVYL